MLDANFWQDKAHSQKIIKEKKLIEELIKSYQNSSKKFEDINDLYKLALEENNQDIQIEVLNGCGEKGVADLYANFLRKNNYDVIDYKNADNFNYNSSKIIVHNNNLAVENVADLFEIESKNVDYLFNENIFYDMTLIVGKDYKQLESFDKVSKYYNPY